MDFHKLSAWVLVPYLTFHKYVLLEAGLHASSYHSVIEITTLPPGPQSESNQVEIYCISIPSPLPPPVTNV